MQLRLLLLSTDAVFREAARMEAQGFPVEFEAAPSADFAASLYAATPDRPPHAVLIDVDPSDRDVAARWVHDSFPASRVVLLVDGETAGTSAGFSSARRGTARPNGEIELSLRRDRDGVREVLRRLVGSPQAQSAPRGEPDEIEMNSLDELVGRSIRFRQVLDIAVKATQEFSAPVLITGEKGTGKRLFARTIHRDCAGSDGLFLHIDCRGSSRELDGLLGGDGGSSPRGSLSPLASRSQMVTLFLEEIAALDTARQTRVLRLLDGLARSKALRQPSELPRLKVIAATATQPDDPRQGGIHPELLARFGPYRIDLPALRDRPSDILLLAERFIDRRRRGSGAGAMAISQDVRARLLGHPWPGNVRELFGALEAALDQVGSAAEIGMDHLPDWVLEEPGSTTLPAAIEATSAGAAPARAVARIAVDGDALVIDLPKEGVSFEAIEKAVLSTALQMAGNNVVRAARLLRLGRGSLRYRLEKYGLVEPKRRRSARRRPVALRDGRAEPIRKVS